MNVKTLRNRVDPSRTVTAKRATCARKQARAAKVASRKIGY